MTTATEMLPRWTKRVLAEMTGRDPLGLSRVSDIITDFLLTGITTTTNRARYYSFYCWALWHIAREESPKTPKNFIDAFRKREAVLALATLANNSKASPVGVLATKPQLLRGEESGIVDCDFRVLPSDELGGYGQSYQGSLHKLGLTYTEGGIDHINEEFAEEMAAAFHETIQRTPYIQNRLFEELRLGLADLEASKARLTLNALPKTFANRERQRLVDLFFGFDTASGLRTDLRRQTLTLILHIISEYERCGVPCSANQIDRYLVCPTYYYGMLWPAESNPITYTAPPGLALCQSLWRQFCLQQFLAQALEELFCSVLETVSDAPASLTLDDLAAGLQSELPVTLQQVTKRACQTPRELLLSYGISKRPDQQTCAMLQQQLSLNDPRSEAHILQIEGYTPNIAASRALLLLANLYTKWRGVRDDPGFIYIDQHAGDNLWAGSILPQLDSWLLESTTWEKALRLLLETLIAQHDRIMYEKGRLDSCWIRRPEGRLIKDQDYEPAQRSSRHAAAVNILCDLALLRVNDDGDLLLTAKGGQLLHKLLEST